MTLVVHEPVTCPGCGRWFVPKRRDQECCGATCRQRRHRERARAYVITEEDRAAMRRAAELVPVPVPPLDPEAVKARILETAVRT